MANFNFVSPGAAAAQGLAQFLAEREARNHQRMIDEIERRNTESMMADREADQQFRVQQEQRIAEAQRQAQEATEKERNFRRYSTIEQNSLPGDQFDPETAKGMREEGFGHVIRETPAIELPPDVEGPTRPALFISRGGSKFVAARERAEERTEQAELNRQFRAEQAAQGRALQRTIAAVNAALRRETANNTATAQEKKAATETAAQIGRAEVATLAQEILDHPALDRSVGWLDARVFSGTNAAIEFDTKVKQLISQLSLNARDKLKGSGAISDFESKTLADSASALNQRGGEAEFRKELVRIIAATSGKPGSYSGKQPSGPAAGQQSSPITRTIRNLQTGETRVQTSTDGGKTWK